MAPTTRAAANWAATYVAALVELWALFAEHSGVVGAFRLMAVCRAARVGAKYWIRTLPRILVCGGTAGEAEDMTREVWRLDLGKLQWERMSDLSCVRNDHACCVMRGGIVVLGGIVEGQEGSEETASVEILGHNDQDEDEGRTFKALPPLSCGPIYRSVAIAIDESESDEGRVLLIGGVYENGDASAVYEVDLATGVCTAQPSLLSPQGSIRHNICTAARLQDGRIICIGEHSDLAATTTQVLEPTTNGLSSEGGWQWRALPSANVVRYTGRGCVLSDGRFAIFGGFDANFDATSSCEALSLSGDVERWDPLPPMHEDRNGFACAAIGGCVIVVGGAGSVTAEVYEEGLGQWRQIPCNLPYDYQLTWMGSAVM